MVTPPLLTGVASSVVARRSPAIQPDKRRVTRVGAGCGVGGSGGRWAAIPAVCRRPDDVLWRVVEPAAVR